MTITYLTGDATQPVIKPALIIHVCNDMGGWGRGFVLALSARWPEPELAYRRMMIWTRGLVDFVSIDKDLYVANMIAQRGIYPDADNRPPIRYEDLADCLKQVRDWVKATDFSIHAPRIGCGLAGGKWSVVEPLLNYYLHDRNVYIYDLPDAA